MGGSDKKEGTAEFKVQKIKHEETAIRNEVKSFSRFKKRAVVEDPEGSVFLLEGKKPINSDYTERRSSIGVLGMLLISAGVCLWLCLTCIVIVVSGLALTNGSYTQELGGTNSMSVPTVALRHKKHLDERNRYFQAYLKENGGQRRKVKNSHGLIQDLNLVILKLKNVVGKYDQKNKTLTTLYKGVTNYGLNNCGKFPFALPEKMESKAFKCKKFKRRRNLKKWTLEIFSKGYNDVSIYDEQFQKLIYYEKLRRFRKRYKSNGSRLTILQELQNEIRALNVEILDILHTKKRLNFSDASPTQTPESETDLMIKEWCTLQLSKDYLSQFCESLEVVVKCWERKRKREWKKKNVSEKVLEGKEFKKNKQRYELTEVESVLCKVN